MPIDHNCSSAIEVVKLRLCRRILGNGVIHVMEKECRSPTVCLQASVTHLGDQVQEMSSTVRLHFPPTRSSFPQKHWSGGAADTKAPHH